MAESGRPLFWNSPAISWKANPVNSSGLSESEVSSMWQNSFSAWSNAGGSNSFSYSQSTSHPASGTFDGSNAIYFSSRAGRSLDYGVVAITEVFYYPSDGHIAEADMVFNDSQFLFTANPGDTGKIINGKYAVYLQDVATHEAGHAFALDHSTVGRSAMIYTAFSGQYNLGEDDLAAMQTLYPATGGLASLRGSVVGLNGGIFGAHVLAINMQTGKVQAGALASNDGTFRIGDIPAGSYAVMMEPYGADISSISSYYQNVNHRFCSAGKFRRRFYSSCGSAGKATVVSVNSGESLALGTLSPSCSQMGNPAGAPTTLASAKNISSLGGAQFGTLAVSDIHYYKISNFSGNISAKAATYSLYSPIDIKVELLAADGSAVASANNIDNVQNPMPGGLINYDSSSEASSLPLGDYYLKVSAASSKIGSSKYPAGFELLDASGHYLLMVGLNSSFGAESPTDMGACVSVNNSAQSPAFRAPSSEEKKQTSTQGCGALALPGGGPFSGSVGQLLCFAFLLRIVFLFSALVRRKR